MQILCLITYTAPDGQLFVAGEIYELAPELALWLLSAAEGQFKLVDDQPSVETHDDASLQGPPLDRAVKRSPRNRGK